MTQIPKSYVLIEIIYLDGSTDSIRAFPSIPGGRYWSYVESIFWGGLGNVEGWLTINDINGNFHAINTMQIRKMWCKYVELNRS